MPESESPPEFEQLLDYLKRARGIDFTGYKRASLQRRIDKRMRAVEIDEYEGYVDYLEVHPNEFVTLFNTILINVTTFFRDAPTWTYLKDSVLPNLLSEIPNDRPIRVWSAGCASGEEAYTLAIVLAELLGVESFKRRVKIYGTDLDEDALQIARNAVYTDAQAAEIPEEWREKYFERSGERLSFRPDLRRSVIFGRLDLLHDSPISRLDLLACRNTLMYLNSDTQRQVIERFHFALNDSGVLFLGKAETLLSQSNLFEPIDRKRRIFAKVPFPRVSRASGDDRMLANIDPANGTRDFDLRSAALEAVTMPALVVNRTGVLVYANESARQLFALGPHDYGQLIQDLEISYRPVELRGPIAESHVQRRAVTLVGVPFAANGNARVLDLTVVPLYSGAEAVGAAVFFDDVTVQRELEAQLLQSTQELEHAYEEVQSTNEELETTNEELQSTNEELETMNEELQSTNDELHVVNEELRIRSDEITNLNSFLQAILTSFRGGVVVVDPHRKIIVWNPQAADLWGMREDEVRGVDFAAIDTGLPVVQLVPLVDEVLSGTDGAGDLTLDAVTRRGRQVRCRVTCSPLRSDGLVAGAIIVMELLE